jgi:thiamine kinase-like enzyme
MSTTICIAPAKTVAYPNGGGHLWVYLQWALALRALGCRVIWLEGVARDTAVDETNRRIATLKARLDRWGLAEGLALCSLDDAPLSPEVAGPFLPLETAAEADLLLNLWHSLPSTVVRRFRRSALIDTDPGLLQIWITTGAVRVAPHDHYFTIGETVGTADARFPDCGLRWLYTPPAIFLPEWPTTLASPSPAPYTTVAHWWGGTFDFNGTTYCNEKRVSFLEYLDLPARTPARLELAVCLAEFYEEYRRLMEPKGWSLREAWEVSATPEAYRAYVQRSRGEFSCAKPAYVALETAWVSDRTLCYLASGKPAIVQHTGPSRWLPSGEGLFRFRNMDEAAGALAVVEADYGRHCRSARALVEQHCDARRVVERVLERALHPGAGVARATPVVDLQGGLRSVLEQSGETGTAELSDVLRDLLDGTNPTRCGLSLTQLKARVYRLEIGDGPWRSVVLKHLDPIVAQRARLAAERWLPALGLGDRCARLLGTAAVRRGDSVWHVYEDLGEETLATTPTPARVGATVDLVAELHTRAARHPVLPEVRRYAPNLGMEYFTANVRDAIAALEALAASGIEPPPEHAQVAPRLLERLYRLSADAARRARTFDEVAGPDTLLHGDLWPINAVVATHAARSRARLVDWDRVGVGPFSYDLSTFLYRFPPDQRPGILEQYRRAVDRAGRPLAPTEQLHVLFDTAERARYANRIIWPALALLQDRAAWGFPELAEVERWFRDLDRSHALGPCDPALC